MMFSTVSSVLGHVKGGRLKALAVVSAKRLEQLPDVPTMLESGYPDSTSGSWQGIFVPAGTPRDIVDRLYALLLQTMKTPDVAERLSKSGIDVVLSASPAAFADYVAAETVRWGKVARESGATVD
jgi:tripartite-type tricarboxylate transporter receptor subunit TctC